MGFKLHFRPKVQFAPEMARIGFPPCPLRCPPAVRGIAPTVAACTVRGGHARAAPPPSCHVHLRPCTLPGGRQRLPLHFRSLPLRSPSPPSLSGAGACSPERGRHECRRRARCRCYCLHSIPPPSEPSAASSSPHRAAPLDLLDRRRWPQLLPAVSEAAVTATATVAAPPQAASGHAGQPSVRTQAQGPSPPLHRRRRRPWPAGAASRPPLPAAVLRKKKEEPARE